MCSSVVFTNICICIYRVDVHNIFLNTFFSHIFWRDFSGILAGKWFIFVWLNICIHFCFKTKSPILNNFVSMKNCELRVWSQNNYNLPSLHFTHLVFILPSDNELAKVNLRFCTLRSLIHWQERFSKRLTINVSVFLLHFLVIIVGCELSQVARNHLCV